jgi:hypothetical protein
MTTLSAPLRLSMHLTLSEVACVNHLDRPFEGVPQGGVIAEYPAAWVSTRGYDLGEAFELIRGIWNLAIVSTSGYRTRSYNSVVSPAAPGSQHVQGRALDLHPPEGISVFDFWSEIVNVAKRAKLTGIGYAAPSAGNFVHIDQRPSPTLIQWRY